MRHAFIEIFDIPAPPPRRRHFTDLHGAVVELRAERQGELITTTLGGPGDD
jgi:hypothetical protein